ncbi:MAG: hypothetical protein AAGJ52_00870 [Pseudomonadota bacterium]
MSIAHLLLKLSALFFVGCLCAPVQAWVSVGSSPGFGTCTYNSLADALTDGEEEIRILDNQVFEENINITSARTLRGGFTSCLAASQNIQLGDLATIDGSAISVLPTVSILANTSVVVTLDKLRIVGGSVGLATGATSGVVNLTDSLISGNSGSVNGAGILVGNPSGILQVVIRESSIFGNTTTASGGGIFCNSPNGRIRLESGAILENSADVDGGGVFVGMGCQFSSFAGSRVEDGSVLRGILSNMAGRWGGGLYAENGGVIEINGHLGPSGLWGNTSRPAVVAENSAASGGGIHATGFGSRVTLIDAVIRDNWANERGGGLRINDGAELTAHISGTDCWNQRRCSHWRDNRVTDGVEHGGHLFLNNGTAQIDRTHLTGGRAELGTAIYALGNNANLSLEGSFLTGNGVFLPPLLDDRYVVRLFNGASASMVHVTIANNSSGTAAIGASGSGTSASISNSIVFNSGLPVSENAATGLALFDCIVANDINFLGSGQIVSDVNFRNALNDDFRLTLESTAVDFCGDAGAVLLDEEGHARGLDEPTEADVDGPFDAGASEYLIVDGLFSDRFHSL